MKIISVMHPYKYAVVILSMLALLSCSRNAVSFSKYFPLEKDKKVVFLRTIDSTNYAFMDTLICREYIGKVGRLSRPWSIFLWHDSAEAGVTGTIPVYYFQQTKKDTASETLLSDHSFMERLLCFKDKKLFVGFEWSGQYDTDLRVLLPARVRKNFDYKHRNGDYWRSFEFTGFETVVVNGTAYKDCLKMDVFETFGHSYRVATVWLAKNIGLVKWSVRNEKVPFRSLPKE